MLMDAGVTGYPLHLTGTGLLMKIPPLAMILNIARSGCAVAVTMIPGCSGLYRHANVL